MVDTGVAAGVGLVGRHAVAEETRLIGTPDLGPFVDALSVSRAAVRCVGARVQATEAGREELCLL